MIIANKQDIVDIADIVRFKAGLIDKMTLNEIANVINEYMPVYSSEEENSNYLIFSSPEAFTVSVSEPGWDGTIEYSTNKKDWTTWDGSEISSASIEDKYIVYLRGIENTKITGSKYNDHAWTLTGSNISCLGNIENLLDYNMVQAGNQLFDMADYCYACMFDRCQSLVQAPTLPATSLADGCYYGMFFSCTGLITAPELPATSLADSCYYQMFSGCTGLTIAPELPATTLATSCYYRMFMRCTGLTIAPELPATILATSCYYQMFYNCTSLITIPALPATTLTDRCYYAMFRDCYAIKISSVQTETYTQAYRIPTSGNGVSKDTSLTDMLYSTGGAFTNTPEINTTYYLDSSCTIVGGDS